MARKLIKYKIYFDTNGIRNEKFFPPDLRKKMSNAKKNKFIKIQYLLPELVRDEWTNNYLTWALPQYTKIYNVNEAFENLEITGHDFKMPKQDDLLHMAEQYLIKSGFEFVPVPYETIDIPSLIQRAVRHQAPFESEGDKGIKDALIAQTIKTEAEKVTNDEMMIFICNDSLFRDYINEIIPESPRFKMIESMNQVQGLIDLELNDLSQELAVKASTKFFINGDSNTLFYTDDIYSRLVTFYDKKFPDADTGGKYVSGVPGTSLTTLQDSLGVSGDAIYSFGRTIINVKETTFKGINHRTLNWSTHISFRKEYLRNNPTLGNNILQQTDITTHIITFEVKWHADLARSNRKLLKPSIESILPIKETKITSNALGRLLDTYGEQQRNIFSSTNSLTESIQNLGQKMSIGSIFSSAPTLTQGGVITSNNSLSGWLKNQVTYKPFWHKQDKIDI